MLLCKLKPVFSRTMVLQKCFQRHFSDSNCNEWKIKSFDEGNAYLSYCIMSLIKNKTYLEQLPESSLVDQILSTIQNQKEISEESKKEISALFTTGIDISNEKFIFSQGRIEEGEIEIPSSQISSNDQKGLHDKDLRSNKTKETIFVFHPTYMVTSQIFEKIYSLKGRKRILTGHYGISKTVSVFLFWKLAQYIDKYRFNSSTPVEEQYYFVPKVFYMTLNEGDTLQSVKRNLFSQADIFFLQKIGKKLEDLIEEYKNYRSTNDGKVYVILICDQINLIAKYVRIAKELEAKKDKTPEEVELLQEAKKIIHKIKNIFDEIMPRFNGILYLSSMLLEPESILELNLTREGRHAHAVIETVDYSSEIFKDENMYELFDYFLIEFEKRLLGNENKQLLTENIKKELKEKCYEYLKKNTEKYFFTPRDLTDKIKEILKDELEHFKNLESEELKIEFIFKEFKNIVEESTKSYGKVLMESFLKKDRNDLIRLEILFEIYSYLVRIKKRTEVKHISTADFKSPDECLSEFLDKRVFYFRKNKQQIELQLPFELILSTFENEIHGNIKNYMSLFKNIYLEELSKNQLGKEAEKFFFLALLAGKTNVEIITPCSNKILFKNIEANSYWFKSIPKFIRNQPAQHNKKQINEKSMKGENLENYSSVHAIKEEISTNLVEEIIPKKNKKEKTMREKPTEEQLKEFNEKKQKREQENLQVDTFYRRNKTFNFLKSFIPNLENMYQEGKSAALFLPTVLREFVKSGKSFEEIRKQIDEKSKCIDGVLVNFPQVNNNIVELWAIDLTVGLNKASEKLKNFIEEFIGFEDRSDTEITLINKNEQEVKFKVYLYYYVLDYTGLSSNMEDELNREFGDFIKFKSSPSTNSEYEIIEIDGKKKSLLSKIGVLNYDENIKFVDPTHGKALAFQEVIYISKKKDKIREKETSSV